MNTIEINVWLIRNKITKSQIARELGVSRSLISHVIAGRVKSKRVIEWLMSRGCSAEYLRYEKDKGERDERRLLK